MTSRTLFALAVAAVLVASCDDAPTTPTTIPERSTAYFAGAMSPGESAFYSFAVNSTANTDVTLVSLLPNQANTPALAIPMSLGIGTPAGTGCRTSSTVTAAPGLSPQLTSATPPTIYCVVIADIGQLTAPVAFTVKIVHP